MAASLKQSSNVVIMLKGMLHGYTMKERFHELLAMYDMKRRNCEQRQLNDRELLHAQEQVIIYLKSSNHSLKLKLASEGAADQIMISSVFRGDVHKPLRLELDRTKVDVVKEKMFDKFQTEYKTLELVRSLRRKRLKRVHIRFRELDVLERLDRDREDKKVEKELMEIEHSIAKTGIELETAKFLQDKYEEMLANLKEDQSHYTNRLDAVRAAIKDNYRELHDIMEIRVEAKESSHRYIIEMQKVTHAAIRNKAARDEITSSKLRQQGQRRFEFKRDRETRAKTEITTTTITTPAIDYLQEKIKQAKMDILRYAETFRSMRQRTMVEVNETIARIVTQADIFDELRRRQCDLQKGHVRLMNDKESTEAEHQRVEYVCVQAICEADRHRDYLHSELVDLRARWAQCEGQLEINGLIKEQVSEGIQVLFGKVRSLKLSPATKDKEKEKALNDYKKLTQCSAKIERLFTELSSETLFHESAGKMCCTLFQEPLEECINMPPVQPHSLAKQLSVEEMLAFESTMGHQVPTREELKKKSQKLIKAKQKIRP